MADQSGTPSVEELHLEPTTSGSLPRRPALWAALVAVALVAGALVVASSGDDAPDRLPVALGAASADESAAGASMLAWVRYVAGDGLPLLGGEAPAYRVRGDVDDARVLALARALGMTGTPERDGSHWHLESDGAVLDVDESLGGTWWYGAPGVVVAIPEHGAALECPPEAGCVEPAPAQRLVEPVPPVELPTEAEARQIALDLLAATGLDVADATVTVEGPYDAWQVLVEPRIEGLPVSGWGATVSVGSEGVITGASGVLGTPARVGSYPLVDTRAAIDRLNDQQLGVGGGPRPLGAADDLVIEDADAPVAVGGGQIPTTTIVDQHCVTEPDGSTVCEAQAGVAICGEPGVDPSKVSHECLRKLLDCAERPAPAPGTDETTVSTLATPDCAEPIPVPEPQPDPEPLEIVLTDAELVLVPLPAIDGSSDLYLVGGYRLSNDDGAVVNAVALDDASLVAPTTAAPDTTVPFQEPTEPAPRDPVQLPEGEEPELGVGYYVDVNTHCGWFVFAERWWATDESTPMRGWSEPTEGGTFTLSSPDEGTFVGDYEGTKWAVFTAQGPAEELPACD